MQIYVSKNGQRFGPYTRTQVTSYVESGVFSSRDPAWWCESIGWRIIGNLPCTYEDTQQPILPTGQPSPNSLTPHFPQENAINNPFPTLNKDTKIRKVQIVKPGQLKDSADLPMSVRVERFFDKHNHKMEFFRTLFGLFTIALQLVILAKLFGYL